MFTSFLLSLFLVNYRNRARRTEAHSLSFSLLAYLAPSSWLDPEPYQDPDDSKWGRRGTTGHVEPHDAIGPRSDEQDDEKPKKRKKRKSWHLHRKIRKVAKLEIGDALEMRGRMIVVMLVVYIYYCHSIVLYCNNIRFKVVVDSCALYECKINGRALSLSF